MSNMKASELIAALAQFPPDDNVDIDALLERLVGERSSDSAADEFDTGDNGLDLLLSATIQLGKGPDHNNMDTVMYWAECMKEVKNRLGDASAEST